MLANEGILGLLVLLAIYGLPLVGFRRAVQSSDPERSAYGLAGGLLVVGMVIGGLTETLFIHSAVITWYTLIVAILYAGAQVKHPAS